MKVYELLLVDDDPLILKSIGSALKKQGYGVTVAGSGEEAVRLLDSETFDLIITDLVMGGSDGMAVLQKSKEVSPETMVIILTGYGDIDSAISALRLDADDYLLKPCETDQLFFRVDRCLQRLDFQRKIKFYEKLLPVCCECKKIRDDTGKEPGTGKWHSIEEYLRDKAKIRVTSTYCPDCAEKLKQELSILKNSDAVISDTYDRL